jgi:hypothetical protein
MSERIARLRFKQYVDTGKEPHPEDPIFPYGWGYESHKKFGEKWKSPSYQETFRGYAKNLIREKEYHYSLLTPPKGGIPSRNLKWDGNGWKLVY